MKAILFILKLPLRLIALLLALIIAVMSAIVNMLIQLGSFVMSPLMVFILGCGIYTVYKQAWNHTLILLMMETACILVLFASSTVQFLLEKGIVKLLVFAIT